MARVDHSTSYYQKMAELQEKLKRSEEERLRLEEKFAIMMKSCREEEEKRIKALRERYERFLEDDKRRRDRNERILHSLEKIESRAATLSAKSERLKLLRKHYEAYLLRMYPLWKKQSSSVLQQPAPQHYPLSLPMDIDKDLSWFGSNSGLYMNDLQLPSAQSSHSPGSDRLWMPPVLSKNISMYDNANPSLHKPVGRKDTVVESCSPGVENALDNYIHRAAELLRVPVEELEGHSEKCDEEKSVHTEQDTSRDLLNVSLSDDGILLEKKKEKTAGNMAIINTKERVGEEHKHDPHAADYLAGGDNALTMLQTAEEIDRFHEEDILNMPEIYQSNDKNMLVKNEPDLSSRRLENSDVDKDAVENKDKEEPVLSKINNENTEEIHNKNIEDQNYLQERFKENIGNETQYYNVENVYDDQEQHINITQQENIDNVNTYQNNQEPDSVTNMEDINYDLEKEPTYEIQETMEPNESDIIQQQLYSDFQENAGNQEPATQNVVPVGREQQSTDGLGEEYQENEPQSQGNAEAQYFNTEDYTLQNQEEPNQYGQEQYMDNTGQQHEPYSDQYLENPLQYEQDQYSDDKEQVYDQQYPENCGNGIENTAQFEEPQYTGNYNEYEGNTCGVNEEQNVNSSQQQGEHYSIDPNASGEKNQSQVYIENDPGYSTIEEPLHCNEDSQPSLPLNTEGGELCSTGPEILVENDEMSNEKVFDENFIPPQSNELKEVNASVDKANENLEETESNKTQQEPNEYEMEDNMGQAGIPDEGNVVEESSVIVANVDIPSNMGEDSEESSAGFWNPPHHSSIPSVDELAPKVSAIVEDTSESSADSQAIQPINLESNTKQELGSLLGVPPEPTGDSSAPSDLDEVEDQLAALVKEHTSSTPTAVKSKPGIKQGIKIKEEKKLEAIQKPVKEKPGARESKSEKAKSEKESKANKNPKSAKPPTRTGPKKPPSLIKVLESDTESLNLDTGGTSNVDSDEFDFSTE